MSHTRGRAPTTRSQQARCACRYAKGVAQIRSIQRKATRARCLARSLDLRPMETAASSLGVALKIAEVRGPNEFASAFTAMAAEGVDAIAIADDPMLITSSLAIADLAARHRLPSTGSRDLAEVGGLIGYGVDALEIFRHAALFVHKILKGVKPSDLPVEQATKFQLIINLKTAKALGLTIPQPVLV